jgi:arylsulfatase B
MPALFLLLSCAAGAAAAAQPLPNLVVIVADDLGWHCGPNREPSLLTPALNEMAAGGVTLSSYYSFKYCSPARASLLTGRFPFKTESTRNNLIPFSQEDGVNLNFTMLPERLAAAATPYESIGVGKWHQVGSHVVLFKFFSFPPTHS